MRAGRFGLRFKTFARVQPELGIFLAEADRQTLARDEPVQFQRCKHGIVERGAARKIRHRDGDVVDHAV
jgi:hypothetical protein